MVRTFVLFRMIPDLQIHLPNFEGKFLSSQDVYDSDISSNAHPEICSRNLYQSQCESDINGAKVFLECKKIWAK